jgi:hypothetical protein
MTCCRVQSLVITVPQPPTEGCSHIMNHHAVRYVRRHASLERRPWLRVAVAALLVTTAVACGDSVGMSDDSYDITFDFSSDYQGWVAGFTDYPVGKETEWAIGSSLAVLPSPLDQSRKGILLSGENHSDDLFMYVTRGVTGLVPNAQYEARFRVTIATNAPRNCVGVGGAPGESVALKVGATSTEPQRIVDAAQYYRANFDHGAQLASGRNASSLGNIATSNANCAVPRYELKEFDGGASPVMVSTDGSGRLWLVVGVDSGFEGTTSVYITSVRVAFNQR